MKKIKYFMLLGVFSLLFVGCEVDSHKVENAYYVQPEAEMLYPNNPETGLPYSADELLTLDHDPLKENFYNKNQNVVLKVRTTTKPASVALIIGSTNNKTQITNIVEDNGAYIITLSTDVLALEVDEGKANGIAFEITYPAENTQGLLVENITYVVNRLLDPREFKSWVFFESEVNTFATAGDDKLVTNSSDFDFRFQGDFTVSIWVKTATANNDKAIFSDSDWSSGGNPGFVFAQYSSSWRGNIADTDNNRIDINGPALNDDQWHLLTVTFDRDGDMVLYTDKAENERKDMSALGNIQSGLPFRIGADGGSKWPYIGKTREVYIHDVALSKKEIEDFYN